MNKWSQHFDACTLWPSDRRTPDFRGLSGALEQAPCSYSPLACTSVLTCRISAPAWWIRHCPGRLQRRDQISLDPRLDSRFFNGPRHPPDQPRQQARGTPPHRLAQRQPRDPPRKGHAPLRAPRRHAGPALLYLEHDGRPNDYFLYQPALKRIRASPNAGERGRLRSRPRVPRHGRRPADADRGRVDRAHDPRQPAGLPPDRARPRAEPQVRAPPGLARRRDLCPLEGRARAPGEVTLRGVTEKVEVVQGVPSPLRIRFDRPLSKQVITMTVEGSTTRSRFRRSSSRRSRW